MSYYTYKEDFTMKFEMKAYSSTRYANMRACDQSYYKFSADWSVPQQRETIDAALKAFDAKLKAIASAEGWGSKSDTPEMIVGLGALRKNFKPGTDGQANSFALYQLERYLLRLWYRGTKEQRDAVTAKLSPKPASKPAASKSVKVKAKVADKPAATKTAPATKDGKPILHEVEVDDPAAAGLINYLASFLQDELTDEQKRTLAAGLVAALK